MHNPLVAAQFIARDQERRINSPAANKGNMKDFLLNEKYTELLKQNGVADARSLCQLAGTDVKKKVAERGTEKILLKSAGGEFETYLKRYRPLPLFEILKNLFSLKPVFFDGAFHEWKALTAFAECGIPAPEPVAAAKFADETCVLSAGIRNYVRASELFGSFSRADFPRKKRIIAKIAKLAATMHRSNFAHQDLYLLHFFVVSSENDKVYLIDLQRVIMSEKLSKRWIAKDLGQLLFSSEGLCSRTDVMRFWLGYAKIIPRFKKDRAFIRRILRKAETIRTRHRKKS
jgi:tRNA A-37 threonylcarbamoyl transferase component Bud32